MQRTVRIPRPSQRTFNVRNEVPVKPLGTGSLRIVTGFFIVLAAGTLLLSLPLASADGEANAPMVALFTAVSALAVTGLVVVDTQAHYSFFGEAVILVLIQVGGIGYMLGVTTALWAFGRRIGLGDAHLLRQYYGSPSLAEATTFAKKIVLFSLAVEVIGAVVLYIAFVAAGVSRGTAAWWSVFHSISAFNNAGFSITGADLVPFAEDFGVLFSVSILVIFGSVGGLPILALVKRSRQRMPLDYLLIFLMTGALLCVGMAFFLVVEWSNPETLGKMAPWQRFPLAFFQSAMPRTAGFAAFDPAALREESQFFTIGLMFIGGAAGSTAGGIKVGTFALLFFVMVAAMRGETETIALKRRIPEVVIRQAIAIVLLAIAAVFATATALAVSSDHSMLDVLFETMSALGTVGLTTGITPLHNNVARLILIAAMLVGRFGPFLLVLAMNRQRPRRTVYTHPEHSVRLG